MKRSKEDAAWSLLIRERANFTCEKCGKWYGEGHRGLHAAHVFSRGNKSVRWDPENGVALCMKDHLYWAHSSPIEFAEWIKKRLGVKRYDALRRRANALTR